MASDPPDDLFAPLKGHKYMSLTTFRKGGVPVATPVWFAERDGKLYVATSRTSGKARRLRHDPIVTVAPCKPNGDLLGPALPGKARILPPDEEAAASRSLARKYWLEKRLLGVAQAIARRKTPERDTFLEIRPV